MNISINEIESIAPNSDAAKNGRALYAKKKFSKLSKSADNTLIFGECVGSGKNPYKCSVDYIESSSPVYRCTCPSRQFPCKHVLGLLYAYAGGETFSEAEIPEDISLKRNKIEKRQEKKQQEVEEAKSASKETGTKTTKSKQNTLIKKFNAQLVGLDIADKLLRSIVQMGLSSVDGKMRNSLNEQIKELGNYYVTGVQTAFNELLVRIEEVKEDKYTLAIDQINFIFALLKKSRDYLNTKIENPETIELNSPIEEQIGYAWKLTELLQHGLFEEKAELIQLSFYNFDNEARREYVDEGYWINLKSGKIYKTKNYRPYKAVKFIKAENCYSEVLTTNELYIYPGDINPRVRWNSSISRKITSDDINKLHSFASENYSELIKLIKGSIKNPLMDKNPVGILRIHKAYKSGTRIVVEDQYENKLLLNNIDYFEKPVENTLSALLPQNPKGLSIVVMFENNIDSGLFTAAPMAIISKNRIIKLLY